MTDLDAGYDSPQFAVALDLGGTALKGAVVGTDGQVVARTRAPVDAMAGPDSVLDAVARTARELTVECHARSGQPPTAVGMAVPGIVDEAAGVVRFAANLGWRDVLARDQLASALGTEVVLSHDVRAGAIAEYTVGAARAMASFLFITLGTGVGGAVVMEGRPYRGGRLLAGEVGHMVVAPDGEPCPCGSRGCLETVASASAIARAYARRSGNAGCSAADVASAVSEGDGIAAAVWAEAVAALALAIVSVMRILDLDAVVVGGGLSAAGEMLLAPLRDGVAASSSYQPPPTIVLAELGNDAGWLGAAIEAWRSRRVMIDARTWRYREIATPSAS